MLCVKYFSKKLHRSLNVTMGFFKYFIVTCNFNAPISRSISMEY